MRRRPQASIAVEMALLIPILLILSFGILEFGRVMQVKHHLAIAARVAGRYASLPRVTSAQVQTEARNYLLAYLPAGTWNVAITVEPPAELELAAEGAIVSVQISVRWEDVQLTGFFSFLDHRTLAEVSRYRREAG